MAYDEQLAQRIRDVLGPRADVGEKKMFGGIAFMVGDRMAVGVVGDDLMVRVGPDAHDEALAQPHARPMDMGGRVSRGFVYVAPAGLATEEALRGWVDRGLQFAATAEPSRRRAKGSGGANR
jgi:TfoX/Sxy family transcriptional regulator of competence genes